MLWKAEINEVVMSDLEPTQHQAGTELAGSDSSPRHALYDL